MRPLKAIIKYFQDRTLKGLERRVIYAAKRACGEFSTFSGLAGAEVALIEAVHALENYERKIKK